MKDYILSLGVLALVFQGCGPTKKEKIGEDVQFRIMSPLVKDTIHIKEFVSEIRASQQVVLRAIVPGRIESLLVDEGEYVQEGQHLFSINNRQFEQDLNRARAATKSAKAELRAAEIELEGSQKLWDKDFISKAEFDLAAAKVEALAAKLEETRSDQAQAGLNLSLAMVRAPFEGTINRIPNKTGSLVEEGGLLSSISDNRLMFAYANFSEVDYLAWSRSGPIVGSEVTLLLADGSPYPHPGLIETLESEFDGSTGTLAFRASFPNPDNILKHGATGKIQLASKIEKALLIPQKATFDRQEHLCVYVVGEDGIVQVRKITPSFRLPHLFVVGEGLSTEDWILCEGIQRVREGDKIDPEPISFSQFFNPKK